MDDVGAVLQRLLVQLPFLLQAFELLGMAAGTSLNVAKCLIIPLWREPLQQAAQRTRRIFPGWLRYALLGQVSRLEL